MNWFKVLTSLPSLLLALSALKGDAEQIAADPELLAEIQANPELAARLQEISTECRNVENDATAVHKSNLWTFFPRLGRLLKDAGLLGSDVAELSIDPGIQAALGSAPHLQALLADISQQWRTVEGDLGSL